MSGKSLDKHLADYIDSRYSLGWSLAHCRHVVLAARQRYRFAKDALPEDSELIATWQLRQPLVMRVPCPVKVLWAVFAIALEFAWGHSKPQGEWIEFGVGLLVAFFALLRPGGMLALTRSCVALPTDSLSG